jgi:spermidine synthase
LGWGWSAGLVAFGSGFGVIGGEVVMQLQYAQIAINAHQSSAAVLGFVLTGLAVGAFLGGRLGWLGRFGVAAAGVVCGLEPWMFQAVRPGLELVPYDLPAAGYFLRLGLLGLGSGVVVMAVAGVVFPRLLDRASGEREVAGLLAVNGIGGWLGAEVMLERVVPVWGLWGSMVFLGVGYGVLGLVTGEGGVGVGRVGTAARLAGAMAVAVSWVSGLWVGRLPQVGLQPGEGLVEVALGREGVVATVKGGEDDWRMLMNNTYTLGGSRAWVNQERQALLPIVLHGGARRVGLLGFATGSTAAGAVADPGVERVDAYELSPLVARMAGAHFGRWNRGVMEDARLRLVVEDARIGVAGRRGEYDVVVGDLFLPWRTGEGRMYSREHFEAVRAALRGGGVFCQWLPLFQLTRAQYEAVLRTFLRVFPEGYLVRGDFYAELPIVGLVGTADGRRLEEWDWGRVDAGCRRVRERAAGVTDPLVRWVEGVAMLVLGGIPDPGPGPVNTLANGWIEWDAGWNIAGMRQPWFIGVPWAEHARGVHRAGVAGIPGPLRRAHDAGQYLLTLEVAAVAGSPLQANLAAQLGDRLPEALREDAGASWQSWPSRVKVPAAVVKGR